VRPPGRLQIRTDHYQIHGMETPPLLAALVGDHADPGSFLAVLPQAELVGRHATAVWQGEVVLETMLGSLGYLLQHGDPRALLARRLLPLQQRWPLALSLANHLNSNYFHWVAETLPLLEALVHLEHAPGLGIPASEPLLVVNAPVPSFVWQWLEIFGIDPTRVRPWSFRRVRVDRLLVPSLRYGRLSDEHPLWARHLYPRWALAFVRQRALAAVAGQPLCVIERCRRVFLNRPRTAGGRCLLNHTEVAACLQRYGYREVLAEQLTVREQIALFASLTHLVAIHGAGMVNLIFSSQVRLIELFPANRHFGFTYQFLQVSGYFCERHHLLACPGDGNQNMQVPLDALEELAKIISDS
jgi:capsular polysaccharide biosynthesis protein